MKKNLIGAGILLLVIMAYSMRGPGYDIVNSDTAASTIVCFGDSLTFGTGASKGMSYPEQLSRMIGRPVINAGIPGDTTETALSRVEEDVLSLSPDLVLITLGGNDLKNGVSKDRAFKNLETIILMLQDQGAMVVMAGIDIPLLGKDYGDSYKTLARETGVLLIPDIFKGIMGKNGLMSDRIHPNAKGYTIIARHFQDAIDPYLKN